MKIIIIDGQGGSLGRALVEGIKRRLPEQRLIAIGVNSIATAAMLKAGADLGASGENPVIVNAADADLIIGPIGLLCANALLGEITPAIAQAVGASKAQKLLLPTNKCSVSVAGVADMPMSEYVRLAIEQVCQLAAAD